MPRKVETPERLLRLNDNLEVVAASSRPRRRRRALRLSRARAFEREQITSANSTSFERLLRTRRLLLAALRVWELKHGIHDSFS
jgi:hypothetical protein